MADMVKTQQSSFGSGWLCLEFANTVDWHASSHPEESLTSYPKLVSWAKTNGALSASAAQSLLVQAEARPAEAKSVLKRAIELREAVYHILSDRVHDLPARVSDLDVLNRAITDMLTRSQLVITGANGFAWGWRDGQASLDAMLWPVVRSAAELLTSGDKLKRVGQCADEQGCGWLFMDTSKNKSRRWCNMGDCGNRAKARRHYQRLMTSGKMVKNES